MKKMILCALALGAQICAIAQEQTFTSSLVPKDPETLATAGVSVLSPDNIAWSSFGGAAMMSFHPGKLDAAASYSTLGALTPGQNRIVLGAGLRVSDRVAISAGGARLGGDSYEIFDAHGVPGGTFDTYGMLISGGVSVKAGENLAFGANVRYARENLYAEESGLSSVMGDVSIAYRKGGLGIMAALSSLGTGVKDMSGVSYSAPMNVYAGVDYELAFADVHKVTLGALADVFFSGSVCASAASTYSFKDMVFLRAGFHYAMEGAPMPSYAGLGAGVKFYGVRLDLSYNSMFGYGNSGLCVSLGYSF